jgi:ribosome-binding ATPase YchF (GTP1/OBG family)
MLRDNDYVAAVREIAAKEGAKVAMVSAGVEAEVAELPIDERKGFFKELGLQESGLDKVVHEGYDLLHLIAFFTLGQKEVHAWTVCKAAAAPDAAGVIHPNLENGFIRAEIIEYADLVRLGSEQAVQDNGLLLVEGKEYLVEDGDIVYIRFNV